MKSRVVSLDQKYSCGSNGEHVDDDDDDDDDVVIIVVVIIVVG